MTVTAPNDVKTNDMCLTFIENGGLLFVAPVIVLLTLAAVMYECKVIDKH